MTAHEGGNNPIPEEFRLFEGGTGGLDSWLGTQVDADVAEALRGMSSAPLTRARLGQLLTLSHEAPPSDAFFTYYWLEAPISHPYDVKKLPKFDGAWLGNNSIVSFDHLYWGLYRFYVDALLYFGSIRIGYHRLRVLSRDGLYRFFRAFRFDTDAMRERGNPLVPTAIAKDNRYLISEMACKSFDTIEVQDGELAHELLRLYEAHRSAGGGPVTAKQLLTGAYDAGQLADRQLQFDLSADDFLEEVFDNEEDLVAKIRRVAEDFEQARSLALHNTRLYMSMVGDLDVYVATSMRERNDFRQMADFCESVFGAQELQDLNLRFFDPTLSAAANHEDKGLIECLMVKCAKALVYQAGLRDSYGKDAEAAMALSLGKPVIIHSDAEYRQRFFRDIHPLSRLIDFSTGVAIGAMVATSTREVSELLRRTFTNDMEYVLEQRRDKYLVLTERLTGSVVRLQTNDEFLRETFWNHYHPEVRVTDES